MYKQSVRANGHSLPATFISCILSLCILATLKQKFLGLSAAQYDVTENIVLAINVLFVLWLLFVSRTEYVYQLIDRDLIVKKLHGGKDNLKCAIAVGSIQSVRPISGMALLRSWWVRSIGFCGDPFAFFSSYVLSYKTAGQKRVMFVFQPDKELIRCLSLQLGDKFILNPAHKAHQPDTK